MLQIVTKMYFRDGALLNSTVHRDVLFTNRAFMRSDMVGMPVGELGPSTPIRPVSTVTVSVTEHLEAEYPAAGRARRDERHRVGRRARRRTVLRPQRGL